jgi:hypothetical protein
VRTAVRSGEWYTGRIAGCSDPGSDMGWGGPVRTAERKRDGGRCASCLPGALMSHVSQEHGVSGVFG